MEKITKIENNDEIIFIKIVVYFKNLKSIFKQFLEN